MGGSYSPMRARMQHDFQVIPGVGFCYILGLYYIYTGYIYYILGYIIYIYYTYVCVCVCVCD